MVHWGTESCDPPTPTGETDGYWRRLLIESAGMVGLARVTEDNAAEWLWRFEFLRRMGDKEAGCLVIPKGKGALEYRPATPLVLHRWVGLWTNWSDITRHAFVKHKYEDLERRCTASVRDAMDAEPVTPRHRRATKKRRVKA